MTEQSSPELDKAIQAYREGKLPQAAAACQAVLETEPTAAGAWHLLGLITLKSQDYDRAERYLMRAVNLKPNAWSFHLNLGAVRAAAGHPHQALLAYRAAATLQPRSADAHFNLGNALLDLGRDLDAESAYKRAVELSPDDADIWAKLAATQANIHKAEAACRSAREALDLNPNHGQARETLARALVERCEIDAAEKELERLDSDHQNNPESTELLGRILITRGVFRDGWQARNQAFEDLARAVGLDNLWSADGTDVPDQIWVEGSSEVAENITLAQLIPHSPLAESEVHLRCPVETHEALRCLNPDLILHPEEDDIPDTMPLTALSALPHQLNLDRESLCALSLSPTTTELGRIESVGVCLDTYGNARLMARDLAPLVQLKSLSLNALGAINDPTPTAISFNAADTSTSLAERIDAQDLIIGGDGPLARLAASRGKTVWLLCGRFPDWTWGLETQQSDLYPRVRLFRQARCGDWHAPVATLTSELRKLSP